MKALKELRMESSSRVKPCRVEYIRLRSVILVLKVNGVALKGLSKGTLLSDVCFQNI